MFSISINNDRNLFSTQEIYDYLENFPDLRAKLKKIRDANAKHCQYATAMDNLKHIDNVPQKIERIHEAIIEGHLLVAHKEFVSVEILVISK